MSDSPYAASGYDIRPDLLESHRETWHRLAGPGTWWTGAERLAIAAETRRAWSCALCAERKAAVSPFAVDGRHDAGDALAPEHVEVIVEFLCEAARDPVANVRFTAVRALETCSKHAGDEAVSTHIRPLLDSLKEDGDDDVRAHVASAAAAL